jgi:hypothetical protein
LPIVAALLLVSVPVVAEPNAWNDWVRDNSPHGFDVTYDGTIWINIEKPGLQDDYAVRAGDLRDAREKGFLYPKFWLRGFHLKNKDVKYRETKSILQIDCKGEKIKTILHVQYDASGKILSEVREETTYQIIIPGTYGAEYHRIFCLFPK